MFAVGVDVNASAGLDTDTCKSACVSSASDSQLLDESKPKLFGAS